VSSREFWVELTPDTRLRRLLALSGALAAAAGFVFIVRLPLPHIARVAMVALWLAWSVRELLRLADAAREIHRIKLNNLGEVWVVDGRGCASEVRLAPGCLVLRRVAWIRLRLPDGRNYGELLTKRVVQDRQWHRLQLVWCQCRQYFAGTGES
jgi:hypothetical protein